VNQSIPLNVPRSQSLIAAHFAFGFGSRKEVQHNAFRLRVHLTVLFLFPRLRRVLQVFELLHFMLRLRSFS